MTVFNQSCQASAVASGRLARQIGKQLPKPLSRTNYVPQSKFASGWGLEGSTTLTPNAAADHFGGGAAAYMNSVVNGAAGINRVFALAPKSLTVTVSCWVKGAVNSSGVYFTLYEFNGGLGENKSGNAALIDGPYADGWARYGLISTFSAAATGANTLAGVRLLASSGSLPVTGYISDIQVEASPIATDNIATAGSAVTVTATQATVARSTTRLVSAAVSATAIVLRASAKGLMSVGTASASLSRAIARSQMATADNLSFMLRLVDKTLVAETNTAATIGRRTGKVLTASSEASSTLSARFIRALKRGIAITGISRGVIYLRGIIRP